MGIRDLPLKVYYNNDEDDLIKDFYNPILEEAIVYKRAAGFFSSSAFWEIIEGIRVFLDNQGTIKLIISPELSEKDIEAITLGQRAKEDIINGFIIANILNKDKYKDQFNLLAWLIYEEKLEIKVVIKQDITSYGIFHDKAAIIYDNNGDKLAFHGSLNESNTAYNLNYESINVFYDWNKSDEVRVKMIERSFDRIWENESEKWSSYSISDSIKNKIIEQKSIERPFSNILYKKNNFLIPDNFKLRDYQMNAVDQWFKNKCKGILEMATGSGKTFTAIFALNKLVGMLKNKGFSCGIVIVVPYKNLLDQWCNELNIFGVSPIKCYDNKSSWYYKSRREISDFNLGVQDDLFLITTNKTFVSEEFQGVLNSLKRDYIFCADEAHHLTANKISNLLPKNTEFRLGLTATLKNEFEEDKVIKTMEYFNGIIFKFSLKEAMENNCLTRYFYYPVFVELDEGEMEEYIKLSRKISKMFNKDNDNEVYKVLINKRRRIILNAKNKISEFSKMKNYICRYNKILVYCGDKIDDDGKFVDKINKIVYDMGISTHTYTSQISSMYRNSVLDDFKNGKFKVLTAIKCLDEGVDIPSLDCAFILSSNMDSKQFIQRRGRILRKSKNKEFAYIYDLIVIPSLDKVKIDNLDFEDKNAQMKIISSELKRVFEFASICENKIEAIGKVTSIFKLYSI